MSHSWHDNAGAKWVALEEWATRFEAAKGRPPMLWLDKACINQQDIAASLACLPVYLAGCQKLLVLAGKTYKERLWCVVEVFTFVRMGGLRENMKMTALGGTEIHEGLAKFDARKAQCFLPRDRHKLCAIVEAGFGDLRPFNRVVRAILVKDHAAPAEQEKL